MNQTTSDTISRITRTLSGLRIPLIINEYQLHEHIAAALSDGRREAVTGILRSLLPEHGTVLVVGLGNPCAPPAARALPP